MVGTCSVHDAEMVGTAGSAIFTMVGTSGEHVAEMVGAVSVAMGFQGAIVSSAPNVVGEVGAVSSASIGAWTVHTARPRRPSATGIGRVGMKAAMNAGRRMVGTILDGSQVEGVGHFIGGRNCARASLAEKKSGLGSRCRRWRRARSLEAMLDFAREGDTVTVTKLDRLARSVRDLMSIVDRLAAKGVALKILAMNMDTATPTGKLMLTILGGVAEFERELMLERQREGIAKAKAEGKYKGRAPTALAKTAEIEALLRQRVGPQQIAQHLSISRSSVYRIMDAARMAKAATDGASAKGL